MRLVVDTNLIVSGLIWGGTPFQLLTRIECGQDILFVSRDMLLELQNVLNYPKIASVLARRHVSWDDLVRWAIEKSTLIVPKPLPNTVISEDPSDDKFLACAKACCADFLVSGDRHLLKLRVWERIPIVSASDYIKFKI
ncbi:MAG TPA: putative toxin-antitoxin system toxin component, PIN family [Verrucomicrobia bacterium]|nr:MAG: putative toxin-antitoxin system toxin component, PIN family [Lentisphaerae bacterium GWF2_57_35]HBA82870.1 putative toxin-antitoxin system toxin component, PIN family [Verrucomicrobiota bacterium]